MDNPPADFTEGLEVYGADLPVEVATFAARIAPEIDEIAHNIRLLTNATTSEIWERGSAAGQKPDMNDLLRLDEEIDSAKKLNGKLRHAIQTVKNEGLGVDLRQVMRAQDQRAIELDTREEICIETEKALDKKDKALMKEKEQLCESVINEGNAQKAAKAEAKEKLKTEEKRLTEWREQLEERERRSDSRRRRRSSTQPKRPRRPACERCWDDSRARSPSERRPPKGVSRAARAKPPMPTHDEFLKTSPSSALTSTTCASLSASPLTLFPPDRPPTISADEYRTKQLLYIFCPTPYA